jgi:enoyl-CoA hydratase/carnithine racemase
LFFCKPYLPTYLPTYLSTYLPTYLPAYLPACLAPQSCSTVRIVKLRKEKRSLQIWGTALEMIRSAIDHKKVFILALNGPGVGGGAAWFQGIADIVLAASGAWLQVPFSQLGLVPENGSIVSWAQSMGVHRANEFLMFGRKMTVEELESWGLVNKVFPLEGFHDSVVGFLEEQLAVNDGLAMMETKRLANLPLREGRINALYNAFDALAERSVDGESTRRFQARIKELEGKFFGNLTLHHATFGFTRLTIMETQRNQRTNPSCKLAVSPARPMCIPRYS